MNLAPATIQTALWALRQQYAQLTADKQHSLPLREIALVNIHMAIDELMTQVPPNEIE